MSLKANLFYETMLDKLFGLEDKGKKKGSALATSALVLMVRRIFDNWK